MTGAAAVRGRSGLVAAALSHTGCVRERNEDAFALLPDDDIYLVADGIGGQQGGEVASQVVVEVLPSLLRKGLAGGADEAAREATMRAALLELGDAVREEGRRWAGLAGMGTTVVVLAVHGESAVLAHLGDSRAYRFRAGELVQLTEDHSVVGILLRLGEITPDAAATHPARGRITRYVGMREAVDPDVVTLTIAPGDRYLLCTDGLSGVLGSGVIAGVLAATPDDPAAACRALVTATLDSGAPDNVTVLVADRPPDDEAALEGGP